MGEILLGPQVWRPSWMDEATAPAIGWRVPSSIERELFEAEMVRYNALMVYPWDIAEQFRQGLAALLPGQPDEVDRLDSLRQRQLNDEEPLTAAETAELAVATDALMKFWPGYNALIEQVARREAILPVHAFRRFVTGWERLIGEKSGEEIAYRQGIDRMVTEAVIDEIDPTILRLCGVHIARGMRPGGLEKNSAPPSSSGVDPATSPEATTKAGKSDPTSGKKTR